MSPAKVVVNGCGQIATSQHLPTYREPADAGVCSLVGVCDQELERVSQAEKQFIVPPAPEPRVAQRPLAPWSPCGGQSTAAWSAPRSHDPRARTLRWHRLPP